jgi:DNA-binding NarL/FixJ family response regulator
VESTLVGRHQELARIVAAVQGAGSGQPRVVSVEGEAGAGKSTLVRHALKDGPADTTVVILRGDERADDVPFATLGELVEVPVDSGVMEAARLVLSRLAELSEAGPLVVVVEDLHWVDLASRQALASAAGRLEHESVVVVGTARPDHTGADDGWARLRQDRDRCERIQVGGLEPDDIAGVAAARGLDLDAASARRLADHTGGNALYVAALLDDIPIEVLTRPGRDLPVPRDLAAVVADRLARAQPEARSLVAALAVLGQPSSLAVIADLAGMADPTEALEQAQASGLVDSRPEAGVAVVAFVHPLYRRAVYEALPPAQRRELHRAAASVTDRRSALAHRVAAADRVDEAFASELEAAVPAIRAEAGPVAAAQLWRWASELSPGRADRERRLLVAAHLLVATDDPTLVELLSAVEDCEDSPARDLVLGQRAWQAGDVGEAAFRLERAAASDDPAVATEALVRLANQLVTLGRGPEAVDAVTRALAHPIDDPALERQAWAMLALGVAGRDGAVAGLDLLAERLPGPARECSMIDTSLLLVRGLLERFALRSTAAIADLTVVVGRSAIAPQGRRRSHVELAQAHYAVGRWDEAIVNARLALELSDDEHQWERAVAHQILASVAAGRGQWEVAADHGRAAATVAAAFDTPETALVVRLVGIAVAQARINVEDLAAATTLRTATSPILSSLSLLHPAALSRIEAGQLDAAEALVDRLVSEGEERLLEVGAQVADLRAQLAVGRGDPDQAEVEFQAALAATTPDTPVLLTLATRSAFGRLLRNQARRHEGIDHLREARAGYDRLGAQPYLDRIDAELADAGLSRPTRRKDRSPLDLTPREQDVVTLVVHGKTNKEVANELFVSEKAVEYHLRNVYGKVGVSSRRELRAHLAAVG